MKTLRFAIAAVAVAGGVSAFATNARVESLGKSSTFIMDDVSIFDNAANINLYPNFLIGELGNYNSIDVLPGENRDPIDAWFGGIFSLKVSADYSLSIAGVLNRREERLLKYLPDNIMDKNGISKKAPVPVTNFDGFLGANLDNKAFGIHIYVAHQNGLSGEDEITSDAFVSAVQLDLGTNIEISSDYAIEASVGTARIQYGPSKRNLFESDLLSFFFDARMFSRISAINGHLIPVLSFRDMNAPGRSELDFNAGMGVDAAFDRGFFWLGLRGFYNKQKAGSTWTKNIYGETVYADLKDNNYWGNERTSLWQVGSIISFGIERNIWWDWFVIRVGGQKVIAYADYKSGDEEGVSILCPTTVTRGGCPSEGNYFVTNPSNDGTKNDNVGFGFGINIEEKLKIDFTVAEDVMFRNPFQGEGRLISRVAATYSF
ncbi:MAG: hypothetical protein LBC87_10020 [Fibromonadaceae bacterium]|jgi:hypothetical protein|nr:hypothetical protein [Fibromonadaceae bacterium]